jgi:hypothetical protein
MGQTITANSYTGGRIRKIEPIGSTGRDLLSRQQITASGWRRNLSPRRVKREVDLISDALRFGLLWYGWATRSQQGGVEDGGKQGVQLGGGLGLCGGYAVLLFHSFQSTSVAWAIASAD